MKFKYVLLIIGLFPIISLNAADKFYKYTLSPIPAPVMYVNGKKAMISSKGITISAEQVESTLFSDTFPIFKGESADAFIMFEISIFNKTSQKIYLDPSFFSLETKKEFRNFYSYDKLFSLLYKLYPNKNSEIILQANLLDFVSPILPEQKRMGYLIATSLKEKADKALLKLDNISLGYEPMGVSFPFNVTRERIYVE